MRSSMKMLPGLVVALLPSIAVAQSNVGELLDAGAKRVSAQEFRDQVVQRNLVGDTATGGAIEIMYSASGSVQGQGADKAYGARSLAGSINGAWMIDDDERICTEMAMMSVTGVSGATGNLVLPRRCQYWFKLDGKYFISDSDWDRRAKVLRREVRATSAPIATPVDLGQLLDVGGKRLSAEEFRSEVVQRLLVGPVAEGVHATEIMYMKNGTIFGRGMLGGPAAGAMPYISGSWTVDQAGGVCATMTTGLTTMPTRCQFWFKLGDGFFVSDSDSNRNTKVLHRPVK